MRPVIDAKAGAGIALRVEIDQQHAAAACRQRCREIDRGGGFPDATLLIGNGDNALGWRHGGMRLRSRTLPSGLPQKPRGW